jgi:hypothetical protein
MEITSTGQTKVANVFKRFEDSLITEFCEKYNIHKIVKRYFDINEMCGEFIDDCSVVLEFYTNLRNVDLEDLESVIYKFKDEKFYTVECKIYDDYIISDKEYEKINKSFLHCTWKDKSYNKELECFNIHITVNH